MNHILGDSRTTETESHVIGRNIVLVGRFVTWTGTLARREVGPLGTRSSATRSRDYWRASDTMHECLAVMWGFGAKSEEGVYFST